MKRSNLMIKSIQNALELGEDLFIHDAFEILKTNFKGKLEIMKPITIYKKIIEIMNYCISGFDEYLEEPHIVEMINEWCEL